MNLNLGVGCLDENSDINCIYICTVIQNIFCKSFPLQSSKNTNTSDGTSVTRLDDSLSLGEVRKYRKMNKTLYFNSTFLSLHGMRTRSILVKFAIAEQGDILLEINERWEEGNCHLLSAPRAIVSNRIGISGSTGYGFWKSTNKSSSSIEFASNKRLTAPPGGTNTSQSIRQKLFDLQDKMVVMPQTVYQCQEEVT